MHELLEDVRIAATEFGGFPEKPPVVELQLLPAPRPPGTCDVDRDCSAASASAGR